MFYILRHGRTDWNEEHRLQGEVDIPLNETGRQMAYDAAEKYKDILKNVPASMVNFDLWYGNIVCVKNEESLKLIIIDPERTFWGDCMFDFANLEFAKMLDKKETTLSAYNKIAKSTVNC